jgi:hypothetical protein
MNAYIVRLEDDKGRLQAHHIFSSRAKADAFLQDQAFPASQSVKIVEREALPSAIQQLAARGR